MRRRRAREVGTQHHGVGEEADDRRELGHRTRRDGRPDREIDPARQSREQRGERGEVARERGGALRAAEAFERGGRLPRERAGDDRAAEALRRRPREIRRQREHRQAGEARLPERERALEACARPGRRLPHRIIGVVDRERRQRRIAAGARRGVGLRHLAVEDRRRRGVAQDVVRHPQQRMPRRREAQQRPARRRGRGEIELDERALAHRGGELLAFAPGRRREVDDLELDFGALVDHLPRMPVDHDEARAQHRLPRGHRGERCPQRAGVDLAFDLPQPRLVVGDAARVEALQEPGARLRARQRDRRAGGAAVDRGRRARRLGAAPLGRDARGETFDRRGVVEQRLRGEIDAELRLHGGDELQASQRIAAGVEEAVGGAHRPRQQRFPQRGEPRLHRIARIDCRAARRRRRGLREREPVDLAARKPRQRVDEDDLRRHEVLGQRAAQRGAQFGGRGVAAGCADDMADEAPRAGFAVHHDARVAHRRQHDERALDLARLDAEAADLDLVVAAAEEHEVAVGKVAREVAGAVEAARGVVAERVADELLGGELRLVEIAARDAGAGDADLARKADRHRPPERVEQVDAHVRQRAADRHDRRRRIAREIGLVVRRGAGRLGGAVGVEPAQPPGGEPLPRGEAVRAHGVHARDDQPQRARPRQTCRFHRRDPLVPVRARQPRDGDPALVDETQEVGDREDPRVGTQHQRTACDEHRKDLGGEDVRADRNELQPPVGGADGVALDERERVVGERAMADRDSLRLARRSGRVHRVREPVEIRCVGQALCGFPRRLVVALVEHQGAPAVLREPRRRARRGDEDRRPCIGGDARDALRGGGRVERQVRAAGFQRAEDRDDELRRALGAHAHQGAGSDPRAAQRGGETVRPHVELAVGQAALARLDGDRPGRAPRLPRDQPVHAIERVERARGGVPLDDEPPALVLRQQRALRERHVALAAHPFEQDAQMLDHRRHRRRVERRALVDDAQPHDGRAEGDQRERMRRRHPEGELAVRPLRALLAQPGADRRVLEDDERAEQRRGMPRTGPLADLRQRRPGVRAHRAPLRAHRLQPSGQGQRGIGGETQRHRVDEQPHRAGEGIGGTAAQGHGDAERHVGLAAVAAQELAPRAEDERVEREVLLARERGERVARLAREPDLVHPVPLAGRRALRSRQAPGERRRRGPPFEGPAPVIARGARVALAEPRDELAIGARRRRQIRGAAGGERVVEVERLAQHDALGTAVERRVVIGEQQPPASLGAAEEREPQQRRHLQVEVAMPVGGDVRFEAAVLLVGREFAPVLDVPGQAGVTVDALPPSVGAFEEKRRAQHRVAVDDALPGLLEQRGVERLPPVADLLLDVRAGIAPREPLRQHHPLQRSERVRILEIRGRQRRGPVGRHPWGRGR